MTRLETNSVERKVIVDALLKLIGEEPVFWIETSRLRKQFPNYFPMTPNVLALGLSDTFVLEVAGLAHRLGLGSLQAPWLWLIRRWLFKDDVPAPHHCESTFDAARRQRLELEARWFHEHYGRRRSILSLSSEYYYSPETVKLAIRRIRRILDVHRSDGRPRRHHYATS